MFVPFFDRRGLAWVLAAAPLSLVIGYGLVGVPSVVAVGPVYYGECIVPLAILTASGMEQLVSSVRGHFGDGVYARGVLTWPVVATVTAFMTFIPAQLASLSLMAAVAQTPYDLAAEKRLDNALVFVQDVPSFRPLPGAWVFFHRNPKPDLSDRVLFVVAGGIRPVKAPRAVLPAFDRVVLAEPRVRLLYAGPVLDAAEGAALTAALARRPWARHIGMVPHAEMPGLLALTDVVLNSSISEGGMANSILEGMAFGRPVLVSDIPGNRGLVEHGVNGLRFTTDDELAGAALLLARDATLRARYLQIADQRLGRADLAVAAYHMGIGNMQNALAAYGKRDIPYARLYFDSTPLRHARAYRILAGLGDDSSTYLWRILAAKEVMRLYREDPNGLARRAELQGRKASAEEVLHPSDRTPAYADPFALGRARASGELAPLGTARPRRDADRPDPREAPRGPRRRGWPRRDDVSPAGARR
jgi:hypothetical protein